MQSGTRQHRYSHDRDLVSAPLAKSTPRRLYAPFLSPSIKSGRKLIGEVFYPVSHPGTSTIVSSASTRPCRVACTTSLQSNTLHSNSLQLRSASHLYSRCVAMWKLRKRCRSDSRGPEVALSSHTRRGRAHPNGNDIHARLDTRFDFTRRLP